MDNSPQSHHGGSVMEVCGKGNKERFVPLGKISSDCLRKYLSVRPYDLQNVFVGLCLRSSKAVSHISIKSFILPCESRLLTAYAVP